MIRLILLIFALMPWVALSQGKYDGEEHGLKVTTYASPLFPGDPGMFSILGGTNEYKGFSVGVSALIYRSERFYWQTGLQVTNIEWTQKSGFLVWGTPSDTLPEQIRYIDDYAYLNVPFGSRFYLNPGAKLKFYLHPSVQADFLMSKKRIQTTVYKNGRVEQTSGSVSTSSMNKINLSLATAAGVEWQIYPTAALFAEPHYFYNLFTATKSEGGKGRFHAFGVNAGFILRL